MRIESWISMKSCRDHDFDSSTRRRGDAGVSPDAIRPRRPAAGREARIVLRALSSTLRPRSPAKPERAAAPRSDEGKWPRWARLLAGVQRRRRVPGEVWQHFRRLRAEIRRLPAPGNQRVDDGFPKRPEGNLQRRGTRGREFA